MDALDFVCLIAIVISQQFLASRVLLGGVHVATNWRHRPLCVVPCLGTWGGGVSQQQLHPALHGVCGGAWCARHTPTRQWLAGGP